MPAFPMPGFLLQSFPTPTLPMQSSLLQSFPMRDVVPTLL
jgi:hypothetical protein